MRLADFILQDMEPILVEWEAFAATLIPAATGMSSLALRDHARQILIAVAKDLRTAQTRHEQSEKSKGRAPLLAGAAETAAQTHAVLRARAGFDVNQLVAEYRALRASVLRLWTDGHPLDRTSLEDMIRFNEAIDQAVAESVSHFHETVERYRDLLLGMLGHDMRTPLNAIVMTARHLRTLNAGETISAAAARLMRSGASMQALLDDLTDFNRTNLGLGLKVTPDEIDLAAVAGDEIEQLRGAHPHRQIEFAASGDTRGRFDGTRVQQVIRNLVGNALAYGAQDTPVQVALRAEGDGVCIEVTNRGHVEPAELAHLFDPLSRGAAQAADHRAPNGLGLGLFIVREIARAHGGEVEARNDAQQTVFTVRLPRDTRAATDVPEE